ncbi:MAG: hypothetical protein KDH09_05155 [Chrysiogenetes bacterium]|nr:hypothetical protein [Chrysiogenetes bacterium]
MTDEQPKPSVMSRSSFLILGFLIGVAAGMWMTMRPAPKVADDAASLRGERLVFPEAGVEVELPQGWKAFKAGGYALATPDSESADERVLAITHRAATSAGMGKIMSPLIREGEGGFYVPDSQLHPCFDAAWVQRGAGELLNKYVVFRDAGKLELRIEAAGGKERLDALLGAVTCTEPAVIAEKEAAAARPEPSLEIRCRVLEPQVTDPENDPRCEQLSRYFGDIQVAHERLIHQDRGAWGEMRFELTSDPSLMTSIATLTRSEFKQHPDFERDVSVRLAKIPYLPAEFGPSKVELRIRVNLPPQK